MLDGLDRPGVTGEPGGIVKPIDVIDRGGNLNAAEVRSPEPDTGTGTGRFQR